MKKGNSTLNLILAIVWFISSIIWILDAKYVIGISYLCMAVTYLITAITQRKKEKDDKQNSGLSGR
jgi:c-di-AMP phosphodiesterase-like protein